MKADLNLTYLHAELARLDLRLRRQIEGWQAAGQDPMDAFRGLYVSDEQAVALLNQPFAGNWGQVVSLDPAEAERLAQAEDKIDQTIQSLIDQACQQQICLRLLHLRQVFGLDRFELDILLICLAPAIDLRYERIYAYLQDDVTRKRPSINLVLNLLCPPGLDRLTGFSYFAEDAPLFDLQFLTHTTEGSFEQPLLSQTLLMDHVLVAWLLGQDRLHPQLIDHGLLFQPQETETDQLLAADFDCVADMSEDEPPLLIFWGPDQAGQDAAARLLVARRQCSLLQINLGKFAKDENGLQSMVKLIWREARLTGSLLYLQDWDSCLSDETVPVDLLRMLCAFPGWLIVAGQSNWQASGLARDRRLIRVEFSLPSFTQRRALWHHFLGETKETLDLEAVAGQFLLTSGQIRDAVAAAHDLAAQAGRPLQNEDLFAAVRAHSNPRLAALARKLTLRYTWQDIVLPTDQIAILHEIVSTVRERSLVLETWGVGQKLAASKGVTILFAGPSGTGKTMAAEIIARELGLDLYKIDLSTVVSKYIGETEKNLERIFNEASSSNAILFFDEADAIFGKRSEVKDAHDRYANIETSYLLQRMEAYDGVTMLATNLRANLDEAFTRRLQFAVDFPFPEKVDRLRIWQTLFPVGVPVVPDIDFELLAGRFKLAGGNIRNIIVAAAYLAAADGKKVTMAHLLHGTRRELQKMGRLIGDETLRVE